MFLYVWLDFKWKTHYWRRFWRHPNDFVNFFLLFFTSFFSLSLFFYLNFFSHIYFDTHTQSSYKNQWFVQSFEWLTATNIDDKTTNLWWYIEYIESFMVGINFYIHHYHHHWHHHLFNLWHGDTIFYEINLNLQ